MLYPINPTPKPRQTRRDKWMQRDCVMRYRAFADMVRAYKVKLLPGAKIVFYIQMPKSWPPFQKELMDGQPHLPKPDIDNLLKSLMDALYKNDSEIWKLGSIEKRWAYKGAILIINECHDKTKIDFKNQNQ